MTTQKVEVTFYTAHEEVPPETEGLFAGLPRTQCMKYVRVFELPYHSLFVGHVVSFYDREYKITQYGLNNAELGILVTEDQVLELLEDAKKAGHRFTIEAGTSINGRSLLDRLW